MLLVALIAAFFIGFFFVYMHRCERGTSARPEIPAAALLVLSRARGRSSGTSSSEVCDAVRGEERRT